MKLHKGLKKDHASEGQSHQSHAQIEIKIREQLHPELKLLDGWKLELKNLSARMDEDDRIVCDLSTFWLPPNRVYLKSQKLVEQPELVVTIILAANDYWITAESEKTKHTRALDVISTLAKFFEYCWINDKYKLSQLTSADFSVLSKSLAKGGWQSAVGIRTRLKKYCCSCSGDDIKRLLRSESGTAQKSINTSRFREALGTNVQGREPKIYYPGLVKIQKNIDITADREPLVQSALDEAQDYRPGYSMLRQILQHINKLYELPFGYGLSFLPYPRTVQTSRSLGRPSGRTRNIGAEEASLLFAEAFRWVYRYGPPLVSLVNEMCLSVIAAHREGRKVLGYQLDSIVANSKNAQWLRENLPVRITSADFGRQTKEGETSVRAAVVCLLSACAFLVGAMNARRRDEVCHRKWGIHRGSARVVNEDLKLYSAEFYIEKTYCDYVVFYINQATMDSIAILESLNSCFDEVDFALGFRDTENIPARQRTLFTYRRFSRIEGVSKERCWFKFEARPGEGAWEFVSLALKNPGMFDLASHMLRRAYALIFIYRYRNATLQALSQQLCHRDLNMSMVYVTDPAFIEDASSIAEKFDVTREKRRIAFARELADVQKEMGEIEDELLVETVIEIISGKPSGGNYRRFIKKFYARFSKHVEFDGKDISERAKLMADTLKKRGHFPKTMRHGQCMAGSTASTQLAKCRSSQPHVLQRSEASPKTCASCAFHYTNDSYLNNLRADLQKLADSGERARDTLAGRRAQEAHANLRRIIELQEQRLGMADSIFRGA